MVQHTDKVAGYALCRAFGTAVPPNLRNSLEEAVAAPRGAWGSDGYTHFMERGSSVLSPVRVRSGGHRSPTPLWRAKANSCREILMGLVMALLLCATVAHSAIYYVSKTGSNSNPGTSNSPWATLTHASSRISPGDTVLVQPGIYGDREVISAVGNAEQRITFRANGAVTNKGQWYITGSHLRIDGFEVTGGGGYSSGPDSFYMSGGNTNIVFANNKFHDSPGNWDTAISVDSMGAAHDVVVTNCSVIHWGAANDAMIVARGYDWLVVGNTISNTFGGDVFRAFGSRHIFRKNKVYDLGSAIAKVYGAGNDNFNGFYYYNSKLSAAFAPSGFVHTNAFGYAWINDSDYMNHGFSNKCSLVSAADLRVTYASASSTISSSWTMHDQAIVSPPRGGSGYVNHPDFFQVFGAGLSSDILVEANYVEGNVIGAICQLSCETTKMPPPINNYVFRNNIFVNLRSASVNIKASWFNNLFYRCGSSSASAITMGMHKLSDPYYRGSAQGSEVKNNIFLACGGGAANSGWYSLANVSGVPDNVRTNCDYNYVSSSVTTWAKVKTDAERDYPPSPFNWYEPHGINGGDPSLPYLSLGGWKPTAGSVLIDAGGPVDVSSDYDGVGRAKGSAIDIGPYEFDPELVAWWPMEDVSQYRLDDWTGNGHTAYNGNPTNWITTAEGPRGRAGVWTQVGTMTNSPPAVYVLSQYAYVTNLAGIEFMTNGTISLWVQWDKYVSDTKGATRHATLLDSGGTTLPYAYPPSGAPHSWRLAYGPASSSVPACGPTFYCYSSSANYPSNMVQFTHPRDATTWHHVTMTWEAGDKVIGYENGIPFSTNSFDRPYLRIAGRSPTSPPPGAHDAIPWMSIGASSHGGSLTWGDDRFPNDGYFVGKMDDIRIYSRALSPNEIAGLYGHGARTESPFLPPPDEVVKAPVISSDLTNITAVVGTSVSFEVTATGTAPLTYSWTRNSIPISGTTATLVIANAQPADAGAYRVSVSNSAGTCVSASANLIVSEVVRPPSRLRAASTSESLTMGVQ